MTMTIEKFLEHCYLNTDKVEITPTRSSHLIDLIADELEYNVLIYKIEDKYNGWFYDDNHLGPRFSVTSATHISLLEDIINVKTKDKIE